MDFRDCQLEAWVLRGFTSSLLIEKVSTASAKLRVSTMEFGIYYSSGVHYLILVWNSWSVGFTH